MPTPITPPLERFWPKVEKTETCWLWTGTVSSNGYGAFWDGKRQECAHRAAYLLLVGPIPAGLTIDHLCRVRRCVNPAHLEVVTYTVNNARSDGSQKAAAKARSATACRSGHPYDEANTYVTTKGHRRCRTCGQAAQRRYSERKRNG